MKVQAIVDIEIDAKEKDCCDVLCPYMMDSAIHCQLSGKKVRLREDKKGDVRRSTFCKKHQFKERLRSLTFVKSFLSE
jgi:hypothetical protein